MPAGRKLQLKQRAMRMAETRQRIAQATYELHSTVGPLQATISAIADRAGVQRLTVYHHFPDERDLHQACVEYGVGLDPPPDPARWRTVANPVARLRDGLSELYAYFQRHESLMVNVIREVPLILPRFDGRPPAALAQFLALPDQLRDALVDAWGPADDVAPALRAVIALAVDFSVWHMLVRRQGLDPAHVLDLMVHLVLCTTPAAAEATNQLSDEATHTAAAIGFLQQALAALAQGPPRTI